MHWRMRVHAAVCVCGACTPACARTCAFLQQAPEHVTWPRPCLRDVAVGVHRSRKGGSVAATEFRDARRRAAAWGKPPEASSGFWGQGSMQERVNSAKGGQRGADFPTHSPEVQCKVPQASRPESGGRRAGRPRLRRGRPCSPHHAKGGPARLSSLHVLYSAPIRRPLPCAQHQLPAPGRQGPGAAFISRSCPSAQEKDGVSGRRREAT